MTKSCNTVTDRIEKSKVALVKQLKKTPIAQIACQRIDISKATYYRWRAKDSLFARAADQAIRFGKSSINDLAESKLINKIQNDNLTAIIFWLKHNHNTYSNDRYVEEYIDTNEIKSVEEKYRETKKFVADRVAKINRLSKEEKTSYEESEKELNDLVDEIMLKYKDPE